ncbi:proteinase inhibitor I4 serpin [Streptomyces spinoverrucosus]|uniref:serpin family protein n=1 Tax=Streptomyces spinoverrucosus TaxID=284043 RepID=UPI0018C433D4|nr:serpin family protein [Streptomyces spinoverrucosus]MBG0852739.1 proteinase inhibitor I4 serpin [Streptomyces spinoverrucosus]
MRIARATTDAVNGLTARWAGTVTDGTAFSAAGVWPLLAFLADGAGGAARAELADAVGLPADRAAGAARELLAAMAAMRGLDSALGLWTKRTPALKEPWESGLPAEARGVLTGDLGTDRAALDAWAEKRTGGLIERMPVALTDDPEMVLASALALRTDWLRPFEQMPMWPADGPWRGRTLVGLSRRSALLDRVGVADTPDGAVTELKVLGDQGISVHLLLGEERMTPGQVLTAGVDVLAGRHRVVPGPRLPYGVAGPGLHVEKMRCATPRPPTLLVRTVAYDMTAEHDLLGLHRLFGLTAARDATRGHFPGISDGPLAVGSARQSAMARFGALGFRAGAGTAIAMAPGGIPDFRYVTTLARATFDRPFGFLALDRRTRLVLAAGWVTDPEPYREDETTDQW